MAQQSTGSTGSGATDAANGNNTSNKKSDKNKPHTIFLLDGSSLFGKVELTDDYTLKVSSDSGIQKIPLAMLGEKDFKQFGFLKDRSNDGKFWSDRKDAVSDQQKKDDAKGDKSGSSSLEISLAEILPFQPLISSYQSSLPVKSDSSASSGGDKEKTASSSNGQGDVPFVPLFSQPGMSSLPTTPMSGMGSGADLPANAAGSLLPGVTGGGLPMSPP